MWWLEKALGRHAKNIGVDDRADSNQSVSMVVAAAGTETESNPSELSRENNLNTAMSEDDKYHVTTDSNAPKELHCISGLTNNPVQDWACSTVVIAEPRAVSGKCTFATKPITASILLIWI